MGYVLVSKNCPACNGKGKGCSKCEGHGYLPWGRLEGDIHSDIMEKATKKKVAGKKKK